MSAHPAASFSSFGPRPARIAPLLIGAAFAAVTMARQTRFGAWLRGFLSVPREHTQLDLLRRRLDAGWSLPELRESILGRRRPMLLAMFGPPRTAALGPTMICGAETVGPAMWRADVWYYVVDGTERTAMAIRFLGGVAREVDFFDAP